MGEVVCRACGIVLGDRMIDDGAEWRTYNTDDAMHSSRADPNRVGEWKLTLYIVFVGSVLQLPVLA